MIPKEQSPKFIQITASPISQDSTSRLVALDEIGNVWVFHSANDAVGMPSGWHILNMKRQTIP